MISVAGEFRDHLLLDEGGSVVMVGQQVAVLSELATVVLRTAVSLETATLDQLVAAVVSEIGAPPEEFSAAELVAGAVDALVALGAVAHVTGV